MHRFFKCLFFLIFVSLSVLSGKNYFFAPAAVFEADIDASFIPRFLVFYTTNEYDDFSEERICCGAGSNKKLSVPLPCEKVNKIRITAYDWNERGSHGRYVIDKAPLGEESYSIANPRIIDQNQLKVKTEDIWLLESGVRNASSKICVLNDKSGTDAALYELKHQTLLSKHFYAGRFFRVLLWSLFCVGLVMGAVTAEPFENSSKKKHFLYAVASVIAVAGTFSISPVYAASQYFTWFSHLSQFWRNIDFCHLSLVVLFYFLYRGAETVLVADERRSVSAKVLTMLFVLSVLMGRSYELCGSCSLLIGFDYAQNIKTAMAFFGFTVFLYTLILLLFKALKRVSFRLFDVLDCAEPKVCGLRLVEWYVSALMKRPFLTTFCSVIAFYVPLLVLKYPCTMCYDGYLQAIQIHAGEKIFNTAVSGCEVMDVVRTAHHPFCHTLLILMLLKAGIWLGNVYVGLFLYSCLQLAFVAASVSFSVRVLLKYAHLRAFYAVWIIVYFCLHPYVNDYMFLVSKDVIYSAAVLCYLSVLFSIMPVHRGEKRPLYLCKWGAGVMLAVAAAAVTVFRNEGAGILLMTSVLGLIFNFRLVKPWLLSVLVVLLSVFFVNFLMRAGNVQPGSRIEALSVPCQQLARALRQHDELFTQTEKQSVKEIFKEQDIAYLYSSGTSDPVKGNFSDEAQGQNIYKLLEIWAKGFLRCPGTYVDAFAQNYYLYVFPGYNMNAGYVGSSGLTVNLGSRLGKPGGEHYMLAARDIISRFNETRNKVWSLPFISLPMLAATYAWIVFILLAYVVRNRCKEGLALLMLPLCLTLIPFLGPTNGDYGRYTYPLMVCMPFVTFAVLRLVKDKLDSDKNNG